MNTTKLINSLKPGQSVALSEKSPKGQLFAERNGKGDKLTIFRQTKNGFVVVSTQKF